MNVVELFAGAGGLTEGVKNAGGQCSLAIEYDKQAGETLSYNHPGINLIVDDIRNIDSNKAIDSCKNSKIDIVTGGPPCQGFSMANRQRLLDDPRNKLYKYYLKLL